MGHFGCNSSSGQSKGKWSLNGLIGNSFEMCHNSNEYIYAFEFCKSIYIEISNSQREYIR